MRFAVVGDPVAHSKSPAIHNAAFAALGIEATYGAIRVPAGEFDRIVAELVQGDLDGVNVTMPLKADAFGSVDDLSPAATVADSVNTVTVHDGALVGHNTDVDGVAYAINKLGVDDSSPVLILGAGGAARAAAVALKGRNLFVAARREAAARSVLETTAVVGDVVAWGEHVDNAIVINATPIGMHGGSLPDLVLEHAAAIVDMAYGEGQTSAVRTGWARELPTADGLDMLVGQAAAAFALFVGVEAPVTIMEAAARGDG